MQAPWPGRCFLILQCWHISRLLFTGRLDGGGTRVASTASSVGHVGAVGEPTCHGGDARGGDVDAEGEPTSPLGGGHVGAEGEPTCHGGRVRGGDVGAEGEPTPPLDRGHVGAEGEPTCHEGGGRGGGVGAVGEPTPTSEGGHVASAASGEVGGDAPAPSSCVISSKAGSAASGDGGIIAFFLLALLVTLGEVARQLRAR